MNLLIKLFYRITGGRPMKQEFSTSAFWDGTGQRAVFYFRDRLEGVLYLAHSKWAFLRVKANNQ